MTFGSAILTTPVRRKGAPRGAPAPTYDCGAHGVLTMAEMCRKAGVTKQTMRYRLGRGWTGAKLLSPAKSQPLAMPMRPVLGIACKLAAYFPDRVPKLKEIQAVRPMSKAAAYRWQVAWREALEAA